MAGGENGQQYVINTFDIGVCMKAIPLIWRFPDTYTKHIIIPGQFHTAMNYMGMITGHKCRGSGYSEILLEAQLVTSGCLKSVLSGKAYSKALFCLKIVCEALERLLMEQYNVGQGCERSEKGVLEPVWSCGIILPPSLIDLLETGTGISSEDEEYEEDDMDYDEMLEYIDDDE